MVALIEVPATPAPGLGFSISHQKVNLEINPAARKLRGSTEISICPHSLDLKAIRLNCRQCKLKRFTINGKALAPASLSYNDPFDHTRLRWQAGVHQHHMLSERLEGQRKTPPDQELIANLPKTVKIQELDPLSVQTGFGREPGDPLTIDPSSNVKATVEQAARFTPVIVYIEFAVENIREGLHFVGWEPGDLRYPHLYSQNSMQGAACNLFPCLDTVDSRCTWEISIKCPRTLGDALMKPILPHGLSNGAYGTFHDSEEIDSSKGFSGEDRSLDLVVVCSGDTTDEIVDPMDSSKKTTSFACTSAISPRHIGFAIGPFEHTDLAAFRESDEDDKLGQNAVPVHGYCLPGRSRDLQNTCLPLAKAIDFFTLTYGSFPFSSYKICFIDEVVPECVDTASLSLCSNRLIFPEDIIEPLDRVTRILVHALACQWIGVNVIPKEPGDLWAVVGIAYYITDMFMRKLSGNNEYRYQQKKAADRICELDISRPSIYDLGRLVFLDSSELDFIAVKAPLVLFILDRRLTKASGSSGLSRIISRVFLNAKVGDLPNGALNTASFMKTCEKVGHAKLDVFFSQWVFGTGCPRFRVTQRFNKKRLVVEMLIHQVQGEITDPDLKSDTFMRDIREEKSGVYAPPLQSAFTGPMTIRVHEADGTPYEHIVEIKDATTKFEIPYNTKYKRLKRSRRQKERTAGPSVDFTSEIQDDMLLYSLGDVLQSEEEMREWRLADWSKEDEEKMSQESYEWIRVDADFEWICKIMLNLPGYMYLSQLQQDRDVVAQLESIQHMSSQREHPLVSTIMVRTLMDRRYFYGIRIAAAEALVKQAKDELGWLGLFHLDKAFQELFCYSDSRMARSNDFSDRASYYIQCAIPRAIAKIRDNNGRAPFAARNAIYEKLRYNDNTNNEFSDCHYVSILMCALAEATATAPPPNEDTFDTDLDNGDDIQFFRSCLEEIDRYRRMDEWIPSYQNIVSISAIECQLKLAQVRAISMKAADFLQYTEPGCYDTVRLVAFSSLMDLGLFKNDHVLRWFLFVLSTDVSPYVRTAMLGIFGKTLGTIAIGNDISQIQESAAQQPGNLIIEEEPSTSARQADLARKQTVSGALAALKTELSRNLTLKGALWAAIESPCLSIKQLTNLLQICSLLYDPETSMKVVLKYPRCWRIRSTGKTTTPLGRPSHILTFSPTNRIRTKPIPKLQPRASAAASHSTTAHTPVPPAPHPTTLKRANTSAAKSSTKVVLKLKKGGPSVGKPESQTNNKPGTPSVSRTSTPAIPHASSPVVPEMTTVDAPAPPRPKKLTLKLNLKGAGKGSLARMPQTPK